jgi:hypothetical protein
MRYASLAVTIGAPPEETVDELKKALDGLNGRKGGRP